MVCGLLRQLDFVYCVMNLGGEIMAACKFHGVMTAASVRLSGWIRGWAQMPVSVPR